MEFLPGVVARPAARVEFAAVVAGLEWAMKEGSARGVAQPE